MRRVFILAVACVAVLGSQTAPAHGSILLLGAENGTFRADVASKLTPLLTAGGHTVSTSNASSSTPDLGTLKTFDAVLVWSNLNFASAVALGDVLADYVDSGGGVVVMTFANDSFGHLKGRWATDGYDAITPGLLKSNSVLLSPPVLPMHPIMSGISDVKTRHHVSGGLVSGASLVASWSDGTIAAAEQTGLAGRSVGLGFRPVSTDVDFRGWDKDTDGGQLIANALLYAANDPVPEPTSLLVWSLLGMLGVVTGTRRRRRTA